MASPDPELQALQEEWAPEWRVWRSHDAAGQPNQWCATRRGEGREFSMTLMERTASDLGAALREQSGRVGQALLRLGYQG